MVHYFEFHISHFILSNPFIPHWFTLIHILFFQIMWNKFTAKNGHTRALNVIGVFFAKQICEFTFQMFTMEIANGFVKLVVTLVHPNKVYQNTKWINIQNRLGIVRIVNSWDLQLNDFTITIPKNIQLNFPMKISSLDVQVAPKALNLKIYSNYILVRIFNP